MFISIHQCTPLYAATCASNVDAVRHIVVQGADVSIKNDDVVSKQDQGFYWGGGGGGGVVLKYTLNKTTAC